SVKSSCLGRGSSQPRLIAWAGDVGYRYPGQTLEPRSFTPAARGLLARSASGLVGCSGRHEGVATAALRGSQTRLTHTTLSPGEPGAIVTRRPEPSDGSPTGVPPYPHIGAAWLLDGPGQLPRGTAP